MTNEQDNAPVAETAGEAVAGCLQFPGKPPQSHTYATEKIAQGWADLDHELGAKVVALYAAPVPAQDDDKLRIAVEALEPFADAYQAYVAVYSELGEFAPSAATEAEQRFSEGERGDTAKEAAFDALAKITFDQLHAVNEALAALKSTAAQEGGSK